MVVSANASNAFPEAPAPKAPLVWSLTLNFHTWWSSLGHEHITDGYGVKVHKALQDHPESLHLWAKLVDKIIQDLGFTACKHEPCLYFNSNYKCEAIYFIRHVDDFAIGCKHQNVADKIIAMIDTKMSISLKPLGVIECFNGVDI